MRQQSSIFDLLLILLFSSSSLPNLSFYSHPNSFPSLPFPSPSPPDLTLCHSFCSFITFLCQPALFFFCLLTFLHSLPSYSPLVLIILSSSLVSVLPSPLPSSLAVRGPAASGSTEVEGHADSGDSRHAAGPSLHCRGAATCPWYY